MLNTAALPESDGPPDIQRGSKAIETEWRDPQDTLKTAKPRMIHGWRRVWTIHSLHRGSPQEITRQHVQAAERLLRDYELAQGRSCAWRVDFIDGGAVQREPSARQLSHLRWYQRALDVLGVQGATVVCCVALDNWTVTRLAAAMGIDRGRAFGRLQAALERLREHYWPPRATTTLRQGGVAAVVAPDVPASRLGRWRANSGP